MRDRNQVVLPFDYEIKIDAKEPVRKLVEICDELDYSKLYDAYVRKWRKVNPRTMFEVLAYGYMNGIYSSREIESACRHDIRFMWILQNEPAPNHVRLTLTSPNGLLFFWRQLESKGGSRIATKRTAFAPWI